MAYQPYDRNPSGIVFFGSSASDQVYESNSNLVYDSGNNRLLTTNLTASNNITADNIIIGNGKTIGSVNKTNAITIAADGSVSLIGDLTVNGTTTTVNSTTLTVEDPIIILGSGTPTSDDNKDRGISFNYYDGSAKTGFFGFDENVGKFTFIPDATISNEVVTGSAGIIVADLEGNASTATTLETGRYIGVADQVTGSGFFNGSQDVIFNVQLTADAINDQTTATVANNTDYLIVASGTSLRKITKANFVSDLGGGTMSSFSVDADQGTAETIENGNTLSLLGGSGLISSVSSTDTVTFDLIIDDTTIGINGSDEVYVKDGGITEEKISRTVDTNVTSSKTANKDITLVNATGGNITISLPEITGPSPQTGKVMVVKRLDGSSNTVSIQRSGSTNTIDGSSSWQLYYRYETLTFVSDGSNWYII
jgi:hypothetical protein